MCHGMGCPYEIDCGVAELDGECGLDIEPGHSFPFDAECMKEHREDEEHGSTSISNRQVR